MDGNNKLNFNTICCFCGQIIDYKSEINITVFFDDKSSSVQETQQFFAHRNCLTSRFHHSVPLHPDLLDDVI